MHKNVPAFIGALQRIPDTNLAIIEKKFRGVCNRYNYNIQQLYKQLRRPTGRFHTSIKFRAIVVTRGNRKLFVKRFRNISMLSERKKLDVLIPHSGILGLPKIHGITDDWVIYEYIEGCYSEYVESRVHLFEVVDHLLNIHKTPCSNPIWYSFLHPKVVKAAGFAKQIPKIVKIIRYYGAPTIASEQLLMLLDRAKYKKKGGWVFDFPVFNAAVLKKYDFVLCHGGYIPRHLFFTPQGLRVIDWEATMLFSRWYDVWLLSSLVPKKLTGTLWVRYIQGYLA